MFDKLQKLWASFQWCLSYTNTDGSQVELELEILDKKANILCIIKWKELVYVTKDKMTILNK